MARRKSLQRIIVALPDATITDAPDAGTGKDALRLHYRQVQEYIATHSYDTFAGLCHWCLKDEQAFTRLDDQRGQYLFCSERCRDASAACHKYEAPAPSVATELMERGEGKRRVARRRKASAQA